MHIIPSGLLLLSSVIRLVLRKLQRKALVEGRVEGNVQHLVCPVIRDRAAHDLLRVHLHALRRRRDVQDAYPRKVHTERIVKLAFGDEGAVMVIKLDEGGRMLLDRYSVIGVQLPRRLAVCTGGNDELEVRLPQLLGGHGALLTERQDDTALDMYGDIGIVDIESFVLALTIERLEREEVVEDVLGEVSGDGGSVFVGNGRDKDGVAVEELEVDGEGVVVLWVLVPERVEDGGAVNVGLVEGGVDVVRQTVTVINLRIELGEQEEIRVLTECPRPCERHRRRRANGRIPEGNRHLGCAGMQCESWSNLHFQWSTYVTHEGVERAQRCPTCTKRLSRVVTYSPHASHQFLCPIHLVPCSSSQSLTKPADISTNHGNMVDTGMSENTSDRVPVMGPITQVVTEPLADLGASTGESRTGDDEGPFAWSTALHGFLGRGGHHRAIQIVFGTQCEMLAEQDSNGQIERTGIVFDETIRVQ